ncbi:MAG: cupin domain-containing protein [Rhodospirillales bacterium]|tara:strand:+ start:239 stop:604 length:366 start_codon:yes stop_codon:yes gene_type:complete
MADDNFFNLHDLAQGIHRVLCEGIETRIFPGEQAMLSVVRAEPNAQGSIHSHPQEQWGVMLEGSGVRTQGGKEFPVKVGDFWCSPGGVEHGFKAGPEGAVILDIFSPPRDEYKKAGAGFSA